MNQKTDIPRKNRIFPPSFLASLLAVVLAVLSAVSGIPVMAKDSTETAAVQEPDTEPYHAQQTSDTDGLTVTADADPGILPQDAELQVTPISEEGDDYAQIQDRLSQDASEKDRELVGFVAWDISFTSNGEEIEPAGDVRISMEWDEAAAPEDLQEDTEVSVLHLPDGEDPEDLGDAAQIESDDDNAVLSVEMTVDSFSVFTITWTRDSSSAQRVGNIRIHTVDADGSEITDPDSYTAAELTKISGESGILDISEWIKSKDVGDYTFTEARLGSISGTAVTGFKVTESRTGTASTYTLQYTSDGTVNSSSTWTDMEDAVSGDEKNNAEVYLIYTIPVTPVCPLTIHFMTLDGQAITDADGNAVTATIDAADYTSEYDLAGYAADNAPDGYIFSTSAMNTDASYNRIMLGSVGGTFFRYMKYENGAVEVARGDKNYTAVTDTDIYITYREDDSLYITVHHVDSNGTTISGDTTRSLTATTTITPASDTETVPGYNSTSEGYFGTTTFTSIRYIKRSSGWINTYTASGQSGDISADLQSEIWLVYEKMTDGAPITWHYVDSEGNALAQNRYSSQLSSGAFTVNSGTFADKWDGYQVSRDELSLAAPDGYTYTGDYLGSTFDSEHQIPSGYRVQYYYNTSSGTWQTGIGATAGDTSSSTHRAFDGYITDIYRVYTKKANTFTVHYVNDQKKQLDGQTDETFTLDGSEGNTEMDLSSGDLVRNIEGKVFIGSYLGTEDSSLTENTSYVTTDYLNVSKVKVGSDGKNSFLINISDGPMTLSMTRSNRWSCTTQKGRTFTLRREVTGSGDSQSVRYSLVDDQISTSAVDLNLKSTDGTTETYVGSSESEKTSEVYTVTVTTRTEGDTTVNLYSLSVSEWQQNDQTDIYQVYGDPSSLENPAITLRNDLVYTGHLVVQMDSALQAALDHAGEEGTSGADVSDVSYTWYKIVNGGTASQVDRKQSGYTWNIAQDASQRTWLDLSADDGALSTDRQSVQYYVVLSYTRGGQTYTATSNQLSMINYDELQNGGFETPVIGSWNAQLSNASYYRQGVWRTTGTNNGRDIEIVNTRNSYWTTPYSVYTNASAAEGYQFAELNCEAAGALYQDVVTHPYETLNYWLSHRARGRYATSTPEYDTMYLVIMPTKLAMTSGANGGELKEQSELQSFIENHGGFATSLADSEEAVVTYRDEESGILIERVSSNDQTWHKVSVANGYTAMAGLTRFFFVAGPTASGDNTVGNFLDDVGFSQQVPDPEENHFQMIVTKTFSNLELSDIAGLVDSFALTVHAYDSETKAENRGSSDASAALDGAKLTFSVSGDNNVVLKAVQGDTDLFAGDSGSGGSVTVNDDAGTVTMTWTLLGNQIDGETWYTVDETGQDLDGYTAVTAQDGTVQRTVNQNGTETTVRKTITSPYAADVSGESIVRMNFTNSYNQNSQITVQKIFSGITPTTVQELSDGYTVALTNGSGTTINLVDNEQKPYSDEKLPEGVQNVSFSSRQGSGGISILSWTITGWDAGEYTVEETGYHPQGEASRYNTLSSVTVNGISVPEQKSSEAGAEVYITKDVTVGGDSPDVPSIKEQNSAVMHDAASEDTVVLTDAQTNLLIAEYTNAGSTGYLVWTPDTLGANVRQAILNYIRNKFGDSSVTLGQISFYSSENPGVMQVNDASIRYDADTRTVTLSSSINTLWNRYYGTTYTLERTVTQNNQSVTEIVANDEPEIRIRNNYSPILKIRKVQKNHNDVLLSGATFRLYRYDNSGNKLYYLRTSTVSAAAFGALAAAKEFTTDSAGTVTVGVLSEGTYYLEESQAPDGYLRVPDIPLRVSEDGVVTLLDNASDVSRTDYAEVTLTDPYYTITVSDTAGSSLPDAGASGRWTMSLAYLLGLAAIAVTGGFIAYKRSRKT